MVFISVHREKWWRWHYLDTASSKFESFCVLLNTKMCRHTSLLAYYTSILLLVLKGLIFHYPFLTSTCLIDLFSTIIFLLQLVSLIYFPLSLFYFNLSHYFKCNTLIDFWSSITSQLKYFLVLLCFKVSYSFSLFQECFLFTKIVCHEI